MDNYAEKWKERKLGYKDCTIIIREKWSKMKD